MRSTSARASFSVIVGWVVLMAGLSSGEFPRAVHAAARRATRNTTANRGIYPPAGVGEGVGVAEGAGAGEGAGVGDGVTVGGGADGFGNGTSLSYCPFTRRA